jgi:hypothetical protein
MDRRSITHEVDAREHRRKFSLVQIWGHRIGGKASPLTQSNRGIQRTTKLGTLDPLTKRNDNKKKTDPLRNVRHARGTRILLSYYDLLSSFMPKALIFPFIPDDHGTLNGSMMFKLVMASFSRCDESGK